MKKPSASSSQPPRRNESLGSPPARHRDWQHDWWLLLVPATVASAAWWFLIAQVLRGVGSVETSGVVTVVIFAVLAFVMVGAMNGVALLSGYLVRSWAWQGVMALIIASPILGFIHFSWWVVAAMMVCAAGIWGAMITTTHDIRSRLVVRPWASLASGSGAIVLGTITSIALLAGNQVVGVNQTPTQRVDRLIHAATTVVEEGLQSVLPEIRPSMTLDQAIQAKLPSADSLLKEIGITDSLSSTQEAQLTKMLRDAFGIERTFEAGQTKTQLTKDLQAVIIQYENQSIDEIRKQLSDRVGIPLRGTETVHQTVLNVIAHQMKEPALRFASFFGVFAAAVAWLLLRVFSSLFTWAAVSCGTAWFWTLRAAKLIVIEQRVEEVQHLDWRGN